MPRRNPERRIPRTAGAVYVRSKEGRGWKVPKNDLVMQGEKIGMSAVLVPAGRFLGARTELGHQLRGAGFDARAIGRPAVRVIGMYDSSREVERRADENRERDTREGWRGDVDPIEAYDFKAAAAMVSTVRNQWVNATVPRKSRRTQFEVGPVGHRREQLPFSGDDAVMVGPRIGTANTGPDVDFSLADPMSLMAEVAGNERLRLSDAVQRPMLPLVRVMGDVSGIDDAIAAFQDYNQAQLILPRFTAFELSTNVVRIGQ